MNILAQYNNLFEKDELVYIEDPILNIKGLAKVIKTCYLSELPKSELTWDWMYGKNFPQIIVHFENQTNPRKHVLYPCDEFKYIKKLICPVKE